MGIIYIIENDINDNKYIGLTTRNLDIRWKEHLRHSSEVVDKAILKYGKEHFTIRQIEECDDSIINDREKYWIKYYDSYNHGYNCTLGGQDGTIKIPNQFEKVKELWDLGYGQKEITQITSLNIETVHNYLLKNGITKKDIRERSKEKLSAFHKKPIILCDEDFNIIKEWDCALEASNELKISEEKIRHICRKKDGKYNGFILRYKEHT